MVSNTLLNRSAPSSTHHHKDEHHLATTQDSKGVTALMPPGSGMKALPCPSTGAWSTDDIRILARRELPMATKVKFVNKELTMGYKGVSWHTIKDIRAKNYTGDSCSKSRCGKGCLTLVKRSLPLVCLQLSQGATTACQRSFQPTAGHPFFNGSHAEPPRPPATKTNDATAPATPRGSSTEAGGRPWTV